MAADMRRWHVRGYRTFPVADPPYRIWAIIQIAETRRGMQAELVRRAQRGDRESFSVLAAGCVDRLYGTARLILRDATLAEDAIQEALVRAWRDLPTLRDVERFDAWVYRLVVHACADLERQRRRWEFEVRVLPVAAAEPDSAAALSDRDELERGLRRLSVPQRTIVVLHFYLDLSLRETAAAMGIPVGTAKSRLHYALDALHASLTAEARSVPIAPGSRTA
jgi:RNA polymerase sigma-70 factor (ECF subfamily)